MILLYLYKRSKYINVNFDLCDHWVIYDPLRSEKTVIAVDRIKTVLSYSHIDISFQENSEKSVEPVLMVVKGLKIYCNIIDNKNNPYYLSNLFIKSGLSELTVYTEQSIFKKQKIINDNLNYIEFEFLDEKNNKIEMTDYFSISVYIH